MNVYDFDNTIYDGDSTKDIVIYGLKKYPKLVISALRKARKLNRDYKHNLVEFERVKETMLSFIFQIENYPKFVNEFVESHMNKIKPFYIARKTENDVILSASYELWVSLFAKNLGVKIVIATKTDSDGKIVGRNCKGEEKLLRLSQTIPGVAIATSYSDSESDKLIMDLAAQGYVVEGNKLKAYYKGYKFKNKK